VEAIRHNRRGDEVTYESLEAASLAEAILWAQGFQGEVTLYLYDLGDGV